MPKIPTHQSSIQLSTQDVGKTVVADVTEQRRMQEIGVKLQNFGQKLQQADDIRQDAKAKAQLSGELQQLKLDALQDPNLDNEQKYRDKIASSISSISGDITSAKARDSFELYSQTAGKTADIGLQTMYWKKNIEELENTTAVQKELYLNSVRAGDTSATQMNEAALKSTYENLKSIGAMSQDEIEFAELELAKETNKINIENAIYADPDKFLKEVNTYTFESDEDKKKDIATARRVSKSFQDQAKFELDKITNASLLSFYERIAKGKEIKVSEINKEAEVKGWTTKQAKQMMDIAFQVPDVIVSLIRIHPI